MKITKRQLRRIVESSYEEIARIRDSGDYEWQDMEYEVVDLMGSMQSIPAEDAIQIMYDALDAPNRSDEGFWQMMLSDGGNLYQALDGLKKTADEEYDPDIPVHEGRIATKVSKRQLKRIISEAMRAPSAEMAAGASEHDAEARGMAASYRRGYSDGYDAPESPPTTGRDREYLRGYYSGAADAEDGRDEKYIREADGSTKKYDDDSALKGKQSDLPDGLQKGIIDKTVEDREEREEEEREEKNEGVALDQMPDAWRQILGNCLGE